MTGWISNCEICNTGLCARFDEELKKGKKQIQIARDLEQESAGTIKAKVILNHYRYHEGKDNPNQKKSYNKKNIEVANNARKFIEKGKIKLSAAQSWNGVLECLTEMNSKIKDLDLPAAPDTMEKIRNAYRILGVTLQI